MQHVVFFVVVLKVLTVHLVSWSQIQVHRCATCLFNTCWNE